MKGHKTYKILTALAIGCAIATNSQAQTEPGSFVKKPAHTIDSLVSQVERDPVVADRFMRHFRMSKAEVVEYLRGLHLARLEKSGSYIVYNVHADGVIRARVFELKKGTMVFADADGRPILKKNCANPLWQPGFENPPVPNSVPATPVLRPGDYEPTDVMVATEIEAPPFVVPSPETTPPGPMTPNRETGIVSGGGQSLIPLLLLGALATTSFGGGKDCPPPIPEPMTMLAFGIPAAAVMLRRRKKPAA